MIKDTEMRVAFHTLGCKVNQYETEAIKEQFKSAGCTIVVIGGSKYSANARPSNPATATSCGIRFPASRKARIAPTDIRSEIAKTAVNPHFLMSSFCIIRYPFSIE